MVLRSIYDFTPIQPLPRDGREFLLFTLTNTGNRPVRFIASEHVLEQREEDSTEAYTFFPPDDDPVIAPNGTAQFAIEFAGNPDSPFFNGEFTANLSLPFEVTEGEPDSEFLDFGMTGEIGRPPGLEIQACGGDLCAPGTADLLVATPPGTVNFTEQQHTYTFKLVNTGDQPLYITEILINSAEFSGNIPTHNFGRPLRDWVPDTFKITFTPTDDGFFSDDVRISFDPQQHPNLNEFTFGIQGQTGDVHLENDDQVLLQNDDLDFEDHSPAPGGSVRETVIVENFGNTTLQGLITLSQLQGSSFSLSPGGTSLNVSIPSGSRQAFEVVMDTGSSGIFEAQLSMDHNVPGPDPYVITASGSVGGGPGGNGDMRVTHGPTTPVNHNSIFSFGITPVGVPVGKNFRIWNEGTEPLIVPRANFQVPSGYQLIETPDGPIPPPDASGTVFWDNFSMRLKADNAGQFNGQVRINNVSGHSPNPYVINVEGNVGPQTPGPDGIRVTHGATEIPHLSLFSFGTTVEGTFIGKNFRIYNETNEALTFPRSLFSVPPGYTLVETPNGPIPPPDGNGNVSWDNFSVHMNASSPGVRNGQVSFVPRRPNGQDLETWRMNVTGNVDPDPICLTDNTAPSLTITEPADGASLLPGNVWIRANASDSESGMDRVRFLVNSNLIKNDTSAPYNVQWNAPIGNHTIKVEAYDNCGNLRIKTISVTVEDPCGQDTQGPSVGITNPANGAELEPQLINITASASDPSGVARVEFYVNGSLKRNDTEAPWNPWPLVYD